MQQRFNTPVVTLTVFAVVLAAQRLHAQAPASPDRPWPIPESATLGAGAYHESRLPAPRTRLDLAALIDLAERNNPQTRVAWEAARAAAAAQGLAESAYMPQLSLEAIGGFERTPLPAPKDLVPEGFFVSNTREVIPSLALKWLLFDFGRRDAQLDEARAESFVANVSFTGAHQALVFHVTQAYFDLGAARGRLRAAQSALTTALVAQEAATAKQANGLATVVTVAQAKRQTAQARSTLAGAEGAERTARANLVAAVGVAADSELDVADTAELPLPAHPQESISAAINQALTHRPDIIAALGKVDAAEAALKVASRAYYPVIGVGANVFQNFGALSSDGKPYSTIDRAGANILFSFSMPLFDGGMRASRESIARSELHEAQDKFDETRDAAADQVVQVYNGLISSLAEYDAATEFSDAAHTAYDAALRSYREGLGTYTELATEEDAVAQADTRVEDARAGAHTAAAALAFAMGSIQGQPPDATTAP